MTIRILFIFLVILLSCLAYAFLLPLIVDLAPNLAFIKPASDVLICLGEFLGGTAFLYSAVLGPDTTIDRFRRPSLFALPPALRRTVTRVAFFIFGLLLVALSIASLSSIIA